MVLRLLRLIGHFGTGMQTQGSRVASACAQGRRASGRSIIRLAAIVSDRIRAGYAALCCS